MGYEVSTAVFEGPFDLLLHLITSDEVDVYEISISTIVDAYVGELEKMTGNLDLATATEFALIAATLIQLKCRRLLPVSGEIDLDEELAMWEERDLLLSKLLEFSAFKDVAAMVRDQMEVAAKSLPRVSGMEEEFFDVVPDLLEGLSPNKLRNAMLKLLTPKVEPQLTLEHVTQAAVSVADTVRMIAERLATEGTATFRELTEHMVIRLEIVVAFLAILELFKQDLVELDQAERFGDIRVTWSPPETEGDAFDLDKIEVSAELSDGSIQKALASVSEEYEG